MRAVVRLELIADDYFYHVKHGTKSLDWQVRYMRRLGHDHSPSWLALLTGVRNGDFLRCWPEGTRDYSAANSVGSRGIYVYYVLRDGIYEVNDRYEFDRVRHYFIRVEQGQIHRISREQAITWLTNTTSASAS